ncbi:MAG: hypothetical protein ACI9GH_000458 [Candidatus Paceibacteria bacterium]|jgi:hypothetical protein
MKKSRIYLVVLLMTLPFILLSLYTLIQYGNHVGTLGMVGFMEGIILFVIVIPAAFFSFVLFVADLVRLKRAKGNIRHEIITFLIPFVILGTIGILLFLLENYCFTNTCDFIPLKEYSY